MRVAIAVDTGAGAIGGTETNTLNLTRSLATAGHAVTLWEVGAGILGRLLDDRDRALFTHRYVPAQGLDELTHSSCARLLDESLPERFLLSKGWVDCINWKLDRLLVGRGIPYLTWEHHPAKPITLRGSLDARASALRRQMKRSLHARAVNRTACVSQAVYHALVNHAGERFAPASVIYPGVCFQALHVSAAMREESRRQFGIPSSAVVLGTVGRLVHHKRNDLVLDAFCDLSERRPDLNLWCLIAGTGPDFDALTERGRASAASDRIRIVGWQEDLTATWNAIDIFPFPSEDEGLGMVIAESVACGCIPICGTAGGMVEVLGEGYPQLYVTSTDPTAWASRIASIADMSIGERRQLADRLRGEIVSRFSAEAQWAKMVEWTSHPIARR